MRSSHITMPALALAIAFSATLGMAATPAPPAQDSTQAVALRVRAILAPVMVAREARDSLTTLADKATGAPSVILEEQVWQRQVEVMAGIRSAAAELDRLRKQGVDLSAARPIVEQAVRSGWPRYLRQLERREALIRTLFEERNAAPEVKRLALESEITETAERTIRMYRDLVEALLVVEPLGVDISRQRTWVIQKITALAEQTNARMIVLVREQAIAAAHVQRSPDDAPARTELDVLDARISRTTTVLEAEIALLERLGQNATALKVDLLLRTGKLTRAIFDPGVISGLFDRWRKDAMEGAATRGPHLLFQLVLVALTLAGFALLARLTRFVVRRAVARADASHLMKATAVAWASKLVMLLGILFILRQLGVQLAPMLAGLGIAGFVLGFALQDTLANFAAGAMILAYHPYDIGDIIEVAGATGTVKRMSLVSTTVLTFDNQTLVVPNKKMWGDVIRNITAQDKRRVDLLFSAGYGDAVVTVERILKEIVEADARVLKDPAPLIKLHQLAESSVNYAVRVWTRQENYWDVYWDITRAVKLRFDEAGVTIPFPQRDVHVSRDGEPGSNPPPK